MRGDPANFVAGRGDGFATCDSNAQVMTRVVTDAVGAYFRRAVSADYAGKYSVLIRNEGKRT